MSSCAARLRHSIRSHLSMWCSRCGDRCILHPAALQPTADSASGAVSSPTGPSLGSTREGYSQYWEGADGRGQDARA